METSGTMTQTKPATMSIAGVMLTLGVSRSTVMRMLNNGTLTSVRIGARRVIYTESVDHVLRNGVARVNRPSRRTA